MKSEAEKVLYQVLFHVNLALDAIAKEDENSVQPEMVLAANRLEIAKALWYAERGISEEPEAEKVS